MVVCAGALLALLAPVRHVLADDVAIPPPVQADLLSKAAAYDRNFAARAGTVARVLIVERPDNILSERVADQMTAALRDVTTIGGLPHIDQVASVSDVTTVGTLCREQHIAVVYIAPGYDDGEVRTMAAHLAGVDVLSVGAVPSYVPDGVVLGFELSAGHPKLLAHLGQARLQHVDFEARLLKLMRIYE